MASMGSLRQIHEENAWSANSHVDPTHSSPTPPDPADQLDPQELKWRDRYIFLRERGYELRPRYRPGWTPSWIGTSLERWKCEDAVDAVYPMLLDARSVKDGRQLCIKMITKKSDEIDIARYLSPTIPNQPSDSKNHSVPILDFFQDPMSPDINYIVMPLLRQFNDPEFLFVGEIIDFVTQLLEGMEFMHRKLVAHADLTSVNIMMDALPILPRGWHFLLPSFAPNGKDILRPRARIDHPVRYYIIDYDCSVRFLPGQSPIIRGLGGRDDDPPELVGREPFDHFKLDVFTLGNVFLKEFRQKYLGLEFLDTLIHFMMTADFHERPTAVVALQHWYKIKSRLNVSVARWRLRKPNETMGIKVIHTLEAAMDGIVNLKSLFDGDEIKTWSNA